MSVLVTNHQLPICNQIFIMAKKPRHLLKKLLEIIGKSGEGRRDISQIGIITYIFHVVHLKN